MVVPAEEEPGCDRDDHHIDHAHECAFIEDSFAGDEAGVEDSPDDCPDQKEAAHHGSHRAASVVRVRAHNVSPIRQASQHG